MRNADYQFLCNNVATLTITWLDNKEVFVMRNYTNIDAKTASIQNKNGEKKEIPCPEVIVVYNKKMGRMDLSDQKVYHRSGRYEYL